MTTIDPRNMDAASLADVAAGTLTDVRRELAIDSGAFPAEVRAAADEFQDAVGDVIAAGRQLEADAAELREKRNMIPAAGQRELRERFLAEASERANAGTQRAEAALSELRERLADAAVPRVDPAREALGRDELRMLIGEASGDKVASRALRIAESGGRDAVAALLSDFGASLLEARGVEPREAAHLRHVARMNVVESAARRPSRHTAEELAAAAAYSRAGALGAAIGGAGSYLHATVQASST